MDKNIQIAQQEIVDSGRSSTGELMIKANGIDICVEAFGDHNDPALLLILGACSSMIRWEEDLCTEFANGGRYVIRYDNRDTGRSTSFTPGEPPYTLEDMADDAIGVLDSFGIERAHVMGASSGGMIAQLIGINHPFRVETLTLCISTPGIPAVAHAVKSDVEAEQEDALPLPSEKMIEDVKKLANIDWSNKERAIEAFMAEAKAMAGSRFPVNENAVLKWAPLEYERQANIYSFRYNTPIAETRTPPWRHRLKEIVAPTLVVHGTDDPVLPYPHGIALSKEIPRARLVTLEGVGHELPRGCWPQLVPKVLEHTSRNRMESA